MVLKVFASRQEKFQSKGPFRGCWACGDARPGALVLQGPLFFGCIGGQARRVSGGRRSLLGEGFGSPAGGWWYLALCEEEGDLSALICCGWGHSNGDGLEGREEGRMG